MDLLVVAVARLVSGRINNDDDDDDNDDDVNGNDDIELTEEWC